MRLALALLLTVAPLSAAAAQSDSVTVNSMGVVAGDGQVLIDPGTGQPRAVPKLLEPWQFGQGPLKLHPPRKTATAPATTAPATAAIPATADSVAIPPEAPKRRHKTAVAALPPQAAPAEAAPVEVAKPRRAAAPKPVSPPKPAAPPPPQSPPPRQAAAPQAADPLQGFGNLQTLTLAPKPAKPAVTPPAASAPPAKAATPKAAPPKAEPVKQASLEPSRPLLPRATPGSRRDTITFSPNASDPSASAVGAVRTLAGGLSDVLADGATRVQLMAYAGQRGEKTSDTRRLSLKRALVVRQLLIDDGIPSERIDVFALGGADDGGALDRVDVLVKR